MSSAYDLVTPDAGDTERAAEAALRPRHLEDFVGQLVVREQLSLVLEAAIARGKTPDHVLLSGPPGLGKNDSLDDYCQRGGGSTSPHLGSRNSASR